MRKLYALLVFVVSAAALIVACGSDSINSDFGDVTTGDSGTTSSSSDPPILGGAASADPDGQAFAIAPVDPVVTFTSGQPAPTVQFKAGKVAGRIINLIYLTPLTSVIA
ncbi:hypothetical protein [Escherichia coli]|uniref:hypothetical protein n=2 Tax=Escherichia coli TaxID=562 RepID=UPI0013F678CE|nr:hypothetical protein [Escherichia coli]QIL68338.1 hypothetical protein F0L67_28075 [Escherichia coli]